MSVFLTPLSLVSSQKRVVGLSKAPSDAWSTDVLPSDTEDRQAETFSEFDEMSVAGGGSIIDDVRSEPDVSDGNEITPLGSGNLAFLCFRFRI